MVTTFGLELVVQLQPVFQAYITVGPQFKGQTRGEPLSCWSLPESAWLSPLLQLDAEGTQGYLILALYIQGTHSPSLMSKVND